MQDIDILVSVERPGPIMDRFVTWPGGLSMSWPRETKSSVVVERSDRRPPVVLQCRSAGGHRDLPFAAALLHRQQEPHVAVRSEPSSMAYLTSTELTFHSSLPGGSRHFPALTLINNPPEAARAYRTEPRPDHALPLLIGA